MPESSPKLAYVSDLSLSPAGGGSYAVNWHAFHQLERCFDVDYCGPIVPHQPAIPKAVSRIRRRLLHLPGGFTYFSPATLDDNARRVLNALPQSADAVMFRSATRWCRVRTSVPYFVYLDAAFHTFFHNTFGARDFVARDLERIWREEAAFLETAAAVFFETSWGLERAKEAYRLQGNHYHAVGRGGVVGPPDADTWSGESRKLVTIAMNFRQKGGDIVLESFRELRKRYPSLEWHVIGAEPDVDWRSIDGMHYEGILRPNNAAESARFEALMADAFLLLHPTREDTSPLVITEAACFGCPAISVNRFAIPELIDDGVTGMLLDPPLSAQALTAAVTELMESPSKYASMRKHARESALEKFTWDRVGDQMNGHIAALIGCASP